MQKQTAILLIVLALTAFWSCKEEMIPEIFNPSTAHEGYIYGLKQANLDQTELGRQFIAAASNALEYPIPVTTPHQEQFYIHPEEPKAFGYLFSGRRGEKINIQIASNSQDSAILFMDLFRVDTTQDQLTLTHIASAEVSSRTLGFEPLKNNQYVLRIQSELLYGGNFSLSIINKASFDFPVTGKDRKAIGSFFGDPRDGGRRKHHGIDIFAARHTPIISPANGLVRFAGEKGLGGRVVWLRDQERNRTLYFAHLEDILVETGDRIEVGDTVGTVGNTGNARTTPPHLHFGIYQRGPIDPFYFVANQNPMVKSIRSDVALLGTMSRLNRAEKIRVQPGDSLIVIPKHQVVQVEAAYENQFRVRLPNKQFAVVSAYRLDPIGEPISQRINYVGNLYHQPTPHSIVLDSISDPTSYQVLGFQKDYQLVQHLGDQLGWLPATSD